MNSDDYMKTDPQSHRDYRRISEAIQYLRNHFAQQPTLEEVAAASGLAPHHFNRLFRKWVGITPKRYLEEITVNHARMLLRKESILDASFELGLSGPSRLHDHFVVLEALSPGEFKSGGKGIEVNTGIATGPFGDTLIASTSRGIHMVAFVDDLETRSREEERLRKSLPGAKFIKNDRLAKEIAAKIFSGIPCTSPRASIESRENLSKIYLSVTGTNFQIQVWRALLRIPEGRIATYQQVADSIGRPDAVRAVAGAIAANPVHYIIPCHRVIRSDGNLGGYRGGTIRKEIILRYELNL